MRLLNVFAFSLFSLTTLAAKKTAVDKYQEYHSRALSSTPLWLDDALYDHLTAAPRNHTLAVLLTALETKYGCALCREFQPEWDLIARSWLKGDKTGQSRVLYGTLDFADGKGVFQRLMLQTAPVLLLFQPTVGPNAKLDGQPIRYDFNNGYDHSLIFGATVPQSAEQVHAYIARHVASDVRPPIVRPVNYIRIVAVTTAVLGLISFFSVASPYILPIIQNRNLWAAISLIAVLLFTSGHMFNHIRKVPYVAGDGKGG
ncbi:MAG: oligosaccharyl transferase subunit ost3/OST6, partial [Candelina submexicana]